MAVIIRPGRKGRRGGQWNRSSEKALLSTPKDVGGGTIKFWVRSDLGITLNGSTVSSWADQSGNGFNVTQGTAANQPTFVASAQNGLPTVRGNGTSTILASATGANFFGSGAYTVFGVWKSTAGAASQFFLENGTGNLGNGIEIGTSATSLRTDTHAGVVAHDDAAISTNVEIWTASRAAASAPTLRVNGSSQSLTNSGNTTLVDPGATCKIALFGSTFPTAWLAGDIYEVICYAKALSASEISRVENYLNKRYGVF